MNSLFLEATTNSPKISLDYETGILDLEGQSYPENAFEFYEPIIEWFSEYFNNEKKQTTVINIKLSYFNSSTSQILFEILDIVQDSTIENLNINWYYDSTQSDGLEEYEDYSDEFNSLDFNAIPF